MTNERFAPSPLNFDAFNEADVRAELLDPMLRSLGYQAGTENNILREGLLRYKYLFLGRKKARDHPISGKPDYVMECEHHGRWILEAKPPSQPLSVDDFEQAQSYALHPNIAAALFVLSNGREIRVYRAISQNLEDVLLKVTFDEIAPMWLEIEALLSPPGFKRHLPLPTWNPGLPVARTYGTSVRLGAGEATPQHVNVSAPGMEEHVGALAHLTNHIARGRCWRGPDGRLQMEVVFRSSNPETQEWLDKKGLSSIKFDTDDQFISISHESPTMVSGTMSASIVIGEEMFDITNWKMMTIPFDLTIDARASASIYLKDDEVVGEYSLMLSAKVAVFATPLFTEQVGTIQIDVIQ